jgi:cellulose synthase/poly-beta-1,6-N-acetylglucosamine synthase-like glycosyltransferase
VAPAAVLLAAAWPGLDMLWRGRDTPRLSSLAADQADQMSLPRVSVVVAARNEADGVRAGVTSLLAQDYPQLEVVVVNDRSTDATGAVLASLASERLRGVSIEELPPGWLGKPHALWVGAQHARGEWLLFTDADVVFAPACVRRAVRYAAAHGLDHLTLTPTLAARGFWLNAFVALFTYLLLISLRLYRVNDPRSGVGVGLGAFNLLRRSAYEAIGTYAAVARRPDDDVRLGQRVRRLGLRQRLLDGSDLMSVEWYPSLRAAVAGLEKNFFAGYDYSVGAALVSQSVLLALFVWPWLAVWRRPRWLWLATIGVNVTTMVAARARLGGRPGPSEVAYALVTPVTAVVVCYAGLRSMLVTVKSGGIRWRDTFYPLSELRGDSG